MSGNAGMCARRKAIQLDPFFTTISQHKIPSVPNVSRQQINDFSASRSSARYIFCMLKIRQDRHALECVSAHRFECTAFISRFMHLFTKEICKPSVRQPERFVGVAYSFLMVFLVMHAIDLPRMGG